LTAIERINSQIITMAAVIPIAIKNHFCHPEPSARKEKAAPELKTNTQLIKSLKRKLAMERKGF
jgi:hypothetical protein